jgi:hypothetical protein
MPETRALRICVFCSSSDAVDPLYFAAAGELGALIACGGHTLIYGGGGVGLMGAVARAAQAGGGRVVGFLPKFMNRTGVAFSSADELVITAGMRERKAGMEEAADAFIAHPGGFGTLEEVAEVITLGQLGQHAKPIALVNTRGFYDPLQQLFERFYGERFAKPQLRGTYALVATPADAMSHIRDFKPVAPVSKWF